MDKAKSSANNVGATFNTTEPSEVVPTITRMCAGTCGNQIPPARLRAIRSARFCVSCQMELGDVPVLKRLDDVGQDGEVHQTYFTQNDTLEREMHRRNMAADSSLFDREQTEIDESSLSPERNSVAATNLASAVVIQEDALHRAASRLAIEQRELAKTSRHQLKSVA